MPSDDDSHAGADLLSSLDFMGEHSNTGAKEFFVLAFSDVPCEASSSGAKKFGLSDGFLDEDSNVTECWISDEDSTSSRSSGQQRKLPFSPSLPHVRAPLWRLGVFAFIASGSGQDEPKADLDSYVAAETSVGLLTYEVPGLPTSRSLWTEAASRP